jgi:serine/threonine-protein kinase HipA
MDKILDVYFHEKVIGQLKQDNHGDMSFKYSLSWLNDPDATRISCSLPLQENTYGRKECHAFFGGILPKI